MTGDSEQMRRVFSARDALRPDAGTPPPPKRSRRSRSQTVTFMNFMLSAVVFAVFIAGVSIFFIKRELTGPGPKATTESVMIRPNTSTRDIANLLQREGFISDARIFLIGLRMNETASTLKAGEYEIRAHSSMQDIMDLLEEGKSVMYSLTIPEGLTVHQVFARIAATEELTGDMPDEMPAEGTLAADTVRFTRGLSRREVVEKLQADQSRLVESVWRRRVKDLPVNTIEEFVTLASIVEKETGRADERSRVAAVFINRLNKGMRLQSDPTILYGLFGGEGRPADRPIYRSDIEKETPYNTYRIKALPPTPIANPGRAALEAVANPSRTNELYFVADGTGGHVFAATLDEHNENVARWRRIERERAKQANAAEKTPVESGAAPQDGGKVN